MVVAVVVVVERGRLELQCWNTSNTYHDDGGDHVSDRWSRNCIKTWKSRLKSTTYKNCNCLSIRSKPNILRITARGHLSITNIKLYYVFMQPITCIIKNNFADIRNWLRYSSRRNGLVYKKASPRPAKCKSNYVMSRKSQKFRNIVKSPRTNWIKQPPRQLPPPPSTPPPVIILQCASLDL